MRVIATVFQPGTTGISAWKRTDRVPFSANDVGHHSMLQIASSHRPVVVYTSTDVLYASYNQLGHQRAALLASFNAPTCLARRHFIELNGCFGSHTVLTDDGNLASCTKLVRKSRLTTRETHADDVGSGRNYVWYEMDFLSRWTAPNQCRVLCIDTPRGLQDALYTALQEPSAVDAADTCAMIRTILPELIDILDRSVWRLRDHVRDLEQTRQRRQKHFSDMHDLARHGTQLSEVLEVSVQSLDGLYKYHGIIHDNHQLELGSNYRAQSAELLRLHMQAVRNLKLRSDATNQRLQNELTLAFYSVASMENSAIKSVTILTMFFLPATYICALFSTTFFSFSSYGLEVSDKFWLYWAVTVPATACIVMGYWLFLRGEMQDKKSEGNIGLSRVAS